MRRSVVILLAGAFLAFADAARGATEVEPLGECVIAITFRFEIETDGQQEFDEFKARMEQVIATYFPSGYVNCCSVLVRPPDIIRNDGLPEDGYDYINLNPVTGPARTIARRHPTVIPGSIVVAQLHRGGPDEDGEAGDWYLDMSDEQILEGIVWFTGIAPTVVVERVATEIGGRQVPTRGTRALGGYENNAGSGNAGRLNDHQLHELLREVDLGDCPEHCRPDDAGKGGGSGTVQGSSRRVLAPTFTMRGARHTARGQDAIARPSTGPVTIDVDIPPGFFFFDYRAPENVGGALDFSQGEGSFTMEVEALPDPILNPTVDPALAGFRLTELTITAESLELAPGVMSGPNTLSLAGPVLVDMGLVEPAVGYMVDETAGDVPDLNDGGYIGTAGIQLVNDVFPASSPAYFNMPLAGGLSYASGGGFVGFFGGLQLFIDIVDVDESGAPAPPAAVALAPNHPNPFRGSTVVRFRVDGSSPTTLRIFDVHGRLVKTMVDGATIPAGTYHLDWDGRSDAGRRVGPGIYFARLTTRDASFTQRMVRID